MGGSLFDRMRTAHIINEDQCKFIFYQIACALAYLHRLKIVKMIRMNENIENFSYFLEYWNLDSSRY